MRSPAASPAAAEPASAGFRQRLRYALAGLDSRDTQQQAVGAARALLSEAAHGPAARAALQELLSGLEAAPRGAVRPRLQLAEMCVLRFMGKGQLQGLLGFVAKQAGTVLGRCSSDAACVKSLAQLLSSCLAKLLHEPPSAYGALQWLDGDALLAEQLCEALLFPAIRTAFRDPDQACVAAGSVVLVALLEVLRAHDGHPEVVEAVRRCLALLLQVVSLGHLAQRVPGALLPACTCVEVLGISTDSDCTRRLLQLSLWAAGAKDSWQVRRDAVRALHKLAVSLQAPLLAGGQLLRTPAVEVLIAFKPQAIEVLESARHDRIAAVRAAAADARESFAALPDPPQPVAGVPAGGNRGGGNGGFQRRPAAGREAVYACGGAKQAAVLHAEGTRPVQAAVAPRFTRPAVPPGLAMDFGVQVFAPPLPPPKQSPPEPPAAGGVEPADAAGGEDQSPARQQLNFEALAQADKEAPLGSSRSPCAVDASAQTGEEPPLHSAAAYTVSSPLAAQLGMLHPLYSGTAAAASPPRAGMLPPDAVALLDQDRQAALAAAAGSPARLDVSHHIHGRVELGITYGHASGVGPAPGASPVPNSAAAAAVAAAAGAALQADLQRGTWWQPAAQAPQHPQQCGGVHPHAMGAPPGAEAASPDVQPPDAVALDRTASTTALAAEASFARTPGVDDSGTTAEPCAPPQADCSAAAAPTATSQAPGMGAPGGGHPMGRSWQAPSADAHSRESSSGGEEHQGRPRQRQRWQLPQHAEADGDCAGAGDPAGDPAPSAPVAAPAARAAAGTPPCSAPAAAAQLQGSGGLRSSRYSHGSIDEQSSGLDELRSVGARVQGLLDALSRDTSCGGGGTSMDCAAADDTADGAEARAAEPGGTQQAPPPAPAGPQGLLNGSSHSSEAATGDHVPLASPHPATALPDPALLAPSLPQWEQQQRQRCAAQEEAEGGSRPQHEAGPVVLGPAVAADDPESLLLLLEEDEQEDEAGRQPVLPGSPEQQQQQALHAAQRQKGQDHMLHGSSDEPLPDVQGQVSLQFNHLFSPSPPAPAAAGATAPDGSGGGGSHGLSQVERALEKLQSLRSTLQSISVSSSGVNAPHRQSSSGDAAATATSGGGCGSLLQPPEGTACLLQPTTAAARSSSDRHLDSQQQQQQQEPGPMAATRECLRQISERLQQAGTSGDALQAAAIELQTTVAAAAAAEASAGPSCENAPADGCQQPRQEQHFSSSAGASCKPPAAVGGLGGGALANGGQCGCQSAECSLCRSVPEQHQKQQQQQLVPIAPPVDGGGGRLRQLLDESDDTALLLSLALKLDMLAKRFTPSRAPSAAAIGAGGGGRALGEGGSAAARLGWGSPQPGSSQCSPATSPPRPWTSITNDLYDATCSPPFDGRMAADGGGDAAADAANARLGFASDEAVAAAAGVGAWACGSASPPPLGAGGGGGGGAAVLAAPQCTPWPELHDEALRQVLGLGLQELRSGGAGALRRVAAAAAGLRSRLEAFGADAAARRRPPTDGGGGGWLAGGGVQPLLVLLMSEYSLALHEALRSWSLQRLLLPAAAAGAGGGGLAELAGLAELRAASVAEQVGWFEERHLPRVAELLAAAAGE